MTLAVLPMLLILLYFEVEKHSIRVELIDKEKYGRTTAVPLIEEKSVLVGKKADTSLFWSLLDRSFANLP